MKKMMMAVFAALVGSSVLAGVCRIGETEYSSLAAAIDAARHGDMIVLTSNINFDNKDIHGNQLCAQNSEGLGALDFAGIDLNGYNLDWGGALSIGDDQGHYAHYGKKFIIPSGSTLSCVLVKAFSTTSTITTEFDVAGSLICTSGSYSFAVNYIKFKLMGATPLVRMNGSEGRLSFGHTDFVLDVTGLEPPFYAAAPFQIVSATGAASSGLSVNGNNSISVHGAGDVSTTVTIPFANVPTISQNVFTPANHLPEGGSFTSTAADGFTAYNVQLAAPAPIVEPPAYNFGSVPAWATTAINSAYERFLEWKGDDETVVVPFITDVHSFYGAFDEGIGYGDSKRHIRILKAAADAFSADATADLGDQGLDYQYIGDTSASEPSSAAHQQARIDAQMQVYADFTRPHMMLVGNHDHGASTNLISNAKFGRYYNRPALPRAASLVTGDNKDYGYLDITAKKTRIFFVNTTETPSGNGYGISADQIEFVRTHLAELGSDWSALVFSHYCIYQELGRWVEPGWAPLGGNIPEMKQVIEEYAARTDGAKLAGVISGDSHFNSHIRTNGVNWVISQGFGGVGDSSLPSEPAQAQKEWFNRSSQTLIDVVAYKPSTGDFATFRVGVGGANNDVYFGNAPVTPNVFTWTGLGGNDKWSNAANWTSDCEDHTVPANGDKVVIKLDCSVVPNNDLVGLELDSLELDYVTPTGGLSPKITGNEIKLPGGDVLYVHNSGSGSAIVGIWTPLYLGDTKNGGENVFTISTRFEQKAGISGPGRLKIDTTAIYEMCSPDTRTAGTTVNNGHLFDFSNANAFGDGTYPMTVTGSSTLRLYAKPNSWIDFSPTATLADSAATANFWGNGTFGGKISGSRLVFESSSDVTFNNVVDMPDGIMHSKWNTANSKITFNQRVNIGEFGRYYVAANGEVYFKGANGRVGRLNALYQNYFAGAENAFGGAVVIFGQQADNKGVIDCCGYNQTIDRFELNPSYPIAAGTPNGHRITSDSAATLTMKGTANCESDAKFDGALSLVWAPTGDYTFSTYSAYGREMPMTGALIVSNGTFKITGANSFPNVSKIVVAPGATLSFENMTVEPFGGNEVRLELDSTSHLNIPTGMTLDIGKVYVGGMPMDGGAYTSSSMPQITGGGTLSIAGLEVGTFTWTGLGGDNKWSTAANWSTDCTDHTVPANGDNVILRVNDGTQPNNDLTGLVLNTFDVEYVGHNGGNGTVQLTGNEISLVGGENAFRVYVSGFGGGSPRINSTMPFNLGDLKNGGTNVFSIAVRFDQKAEIRGSGYLKIDASKIYDMYSTDTRTAGTTINMVSGCLFDFENANSFGDGTYPTTITGVGIVRFYAVPQFWFDVRPVGAIGEHSPSLQFHGRASNYPQKLTGTRLAFTAYGDVNFNNSIDVDGPFYRCYDHAEDRGGNVTMNGSVDVDEFGRYYVASPGTNFFNHADNRIGQLHSLYQNSIAGAVNAIGGAVIDFGEQSDDRGVVDCNGYNQTIDRIVLNPSYPIAAGTPNGHRITSASAATLTMKGTANCESDAKFDGALSLVWAPTGDYTFSTYSAYGRAMPMTGALIVSNGTFKITGANSFPNISKAVVASGATLSLTDSDGTPFGSSKPAIELVTGASLAIPSGMTLEVDSATLNGVPLSNGSYTSANLASITGAGTLKVGNEIIVEVDGVSVTITDDALENIFGGVVPTAADLKAPASNGYSVFVDYVLGIDPTSATKPVVNFRNASAANKLALGVDNVNVNSGAGVDVTFLLKSADEVGGPYTTVTSNSTGEFEVDMPEDTVKFYKIGFEFE